MSKSAPSGLIDSRSMDAPKLPVGRPPTKREVWDRFSFIYRDIKTPDELKRFCRDAWVWGYVHAVNFKQWRKQPDWVEGDPVIDAAVRTEPFPPDMGVWIRTVNRLYDIAQAATVRRAA